MVNQNKTFSFKIKRLANKSVFPSDVEKIVASFGQLGPNSDPYTIQEWAQ